MAGDPIEYVVTTLAQNYSTHLKAAQATSKGKPASRVAAANAGTQAGKDWTEDMLRQGVKMLSCRTGVDTGRGGHSRYDAVFNFAETDIYMRRKPQLTEVATNLRKRKDS